MVNGNLFTSSEIGKEPHNLIAHGADPDLSQNSFCIAKTVSTYALISFQDFK